MKSISTLSLLGFVCCAFAVGCGPMRHRGPAGGCGCHHEMEKCHHCGSCSDCSHCGGEGSCGGGGSCGASEGECGGNKGPRAEMAPPHHVGGGCPMSKAPAPERVTPKMKKKAAK